MKIFYRVVMAFVAVASVISIGQPVQAKSSGDEWRAIADRAMELYGVSGGTMTNEPQGRGAALGAIGMLYGWDDPRIPPIITRLGQLRNADGGWGLNYAWDAYQDGTVNPANTTYTVTIAGHVGTPLLMAYLGGAPVNPTWISDIVTLLKSTPRINLPNGTCISYSRNLNDKKTGYCSHNVNAGAGAFLKYAAENGFDQYDVAPLVTSIARRESFAYVEANYAWPYIDTQTAPQDPDHGSYSAISMADLVPTVGREAALKIFNTSTSSDQMTRAKMSLTSMPGGVWSGSTTHKTMWCQKGDAILPAARAYVESRAGNQQDLAGAAHTAARAWLACRTDV